MDIGNIVLACFQGLALSLIVFFVNKASEKKIAEAAEGGFVLRTHKLFKILGYISIAVGLIALFLSVLDGAEAIIYGTLICLLFIGLGMPLLLFFANHRCYFDEDSIVVYSWRNKRTAIKWVEITDIRYQTFSDYMHIKGPEQKLKIHRQMVGLASFFDKMEEKTRWREADLKSPLPL